MNVRLFYFLIIFRDLADDKHILGRKLHSGTSKTTESRAGLVRVPLFWKCHCVTCIPA